jgi:macrolide transport system ATP-binding/permease protein
MSWVANLRMRVRGLFRGEDVHREIADEWAFHVEMRAAENVRRGMAPETARAEAERHFGNSAHIKDLSWDERGGGTFETLWQDLRFGARQLRKTPGFTAVALLSLVLGIGANAVIFSLISTILLRPLPIERPSEVVAISQTKQGNSLYVQPMAYPNYLDFQERNHSLASMGVYRFAPMSLSHNGNNERVWGYLVSGNYFELLGVRPARGRMFTAEEDRKPLANPVVVLSYGSWKRRFGGDESLVGKTILINSHSFSVVGVAPPEFFGTETIFTPEFWTPSSMMGWIETSDGRDYRGNGSWFAIGRLKPGMSAKQAEVELNTVAEGLSHQYPNEDEGMAVMLTPPGLIMPSLRNAILAFSGALMLTVGLVLLIACTNLASLLLARATTRRKEVAVRMAIGATRSRLARQLLTESLLLSVIGAGLGLLLGVVLMHAAQAALPATDFALKLDLRLDWRVVAFVSSLAILTGVGFGLIPALQATKGDVVTSLKEDMAGGRGRLWLRSGLVVLQVALSLVLLITAGLTVRSLQQTTKAGPGFVVDHALTMAVDLGLQGYDSTKGGNFYRQISERVKALPGVDAVGWISVLPLELGGNSTNAYPADRPMPKTSEMPSVIYNSTTPGYFAAMGIPMVSGRDFAETDGKKSPPVLIVNQTLADRFWPGQDAVGKGMKTGNGGDAVTAEVIGVAKNGKYQSIGEDRTMTVYYPMTQRYSPQAAMAVRTETDAKAAILSVRGEVEKMDATLPVYNVKTLEEHMGFALFPLHAGAVAVGSFAVIAMILATIGIYGVMAYSVGQRTQEIGIRMAMGARAGDVWRLVLRQGMMITGIGIVLGLVGAYAMSRVVAGLLYGVSATDAVTFVAVSVLLGIVAMVACFVPARRAGNVDPVVAIRNL